ncbi:hypothetical protein ACOQFV_04715 [Nocardiopsis changdeensis]|uniref:Histone protein n=1 Tax=Nocardiopsis changdeensis TaxID=2831969 RepID=A0ABX8BNI5_9ACTN|nr:MULTISPECIES: hypothetical protein [Nocardiopsis]QUX23193.1 hypothetical protein KGD84_01970 [Nocardiopsis changdeensis]QYX39136.1 hypothetical protein K1J57_11420 [Nocardiopsis sp. MT53]
MGDTAKIVAAVAGGYVLGRRRKLKLAIALGLYLGAKKLDIDPRRIGRDLLKEVSSLPAVGDLKLQSREQLVEAGRAAVGGIADRWAGGLAESLENRTSRLREGLAPEKGGSEDSGDGRPDAEAESEDGGPPEEPEKEDSSEDEGSAKGGTSGAKGTRKRGRARSGAERAKSAAGRTAGAARKTASRRKRAADDEGEDRDED